MDTFENVKLDNISRQLVARSPIHGPLVLMYHGITEGDKPRWEWEVTLTQFCNHLDLILQLGYLVVSLKDICSKAISSPTIAITFDDGFADNYAAVEALQNRNITASWYVVSNYIGKCAGWSQHRAERRPMLTAQSLRDMAASGMRIGSHSCSHVKLTEVDRDSARTEVRDSKAQLEDILGQQVVEFAYPYGDYNDDIVKLVRNAGYGFACTSRTGWALLDNDRLQIRRIGVFAGDSASTLARKLVFADNDVGWLRVLRYGVRRLKARARGRH